MIYSELPIPDGVLEDVEMRVQENIYGHRFNPDQEPFMILLEALTVCSAHELGTTLPSDSAHESISYELHHKKKLRYLLFADRHLSKIEVDDRVPEGEKWECWKKCVNAQFPSSDDQQDEFAYLDEAFNRDIHSLSQAVRILKAQEVDILHNRRWTSRFLSVSGPNTVLTDVREGKGNSWSTDRRFFARGGEIVYLMLNRSSDSKALAALIKKRLLSESNPLDQMAKKLSHDPSDSKSTTNTGYLPVKQHPSYERMSTDWTAILKLNLPDSHLFEPLFRITGLNIITYVSERSQDTLKENIREPIIVDLTNGTDKQLRESAKEHLNRHRQVANRAIKAYIENRLTNDIGWQTAVSQNDSLAASSVLTRIFSFKGGEHKNLTPINQLKEFTQKALERNKNNPHKYLLPMAKGIGLATSRPGVGTWFCMDDAMLSALVFANVSKTLELRDFIAVLYQRYGLVIGAEEARNAFTRLPVSIQSFESNLTALEKRMTNLGLTERLSDDCAFVINPYREEK